MSTEVVDRLARIETKLDTTLERIDDHEGRLRTNEEWQSGMKSWRSGLAGWQSVLTVVLGAILYRLKG